MSIEDLEKRREVIVTKTSENRGEQFHSIVPSTELANGILMVWNLDVYGNPTSIAIPNEMKQISSTHFTVQTDQLPDDTQDIYILDANDNYLERVYSEKHLVDNPNAFYVHNGTGIIKFHSSKGGMNVIISYYGKGVMMISDSRIFHNKEGSVVDTLDNIIEKAEDGLAVVESAGGLIHVMQEIDRKTQAGNNVVSKIEETIDKAQMFGCIADFTRQSFILKTEEGIVPSSEIATVFSKLYAYKGGTPITPTIITEADGTIRGQDCVLRVSNANEVRMVSISQDPSIKQASCIVQVKLSKNDLFVGNGEGTDIVLEKEFVFAKVSDGEDIYDYTLSNSFHSFVANYEGFIYNIQEVEIELNVTKANVPVTMQNITVTVPSAYRGAFQTEVLGNKVTIRALESDLMPNNGAIAISVTVDGKVLTKDFNFSKVKDGAASKLLSITGETVFRYDNHECTGIPDLFQATLIATPQNVPGQPDPLWTYQDELGYYHVMPADVEVDNLTAKIRHDSSIWMGRKSVNIKCDLIGDEIFDTVTLIKVGTGKDGSEPFYVTLSNETLSVTMDNNNVVIDNVNNIYTDIEARLGSTDVTSACQINIVEEHECSTKVVIAPNGKYRIQLKTIYEIYEEDNNNEEYRNAIRYEDGTWIEMEDQPGVSIDLEQGDSTPAMSSNDTSWVAFDVVYNDYTIRKVFTIAKSIQGANGDQGEKGDSIFIQVTEGTRSIVYSQVSHDPRPSISKTFYAKVINNGVEVEDSEVQYYWVATGHLSGGGIGNHFTPTISTIYDETLSNNEIRVTATYNGVNYVYYIPISVTRDANGLDWVQTWDGTKTEINDEMVLTPKIFAGTTREEGGRMIPTGVAMGIESLNNQHSTGIAGYQDGEVSFMLDVDGSLLVGKMPTGNNTGLYYSNGKFMLNVNQLSITGVKVPTEEEVNNALNSGIQNVKDEFNQTIINIQDEIVDLNGALEDGLADAELSSVERAKISAILETLRVEYTSLVNQAAKINLNPDFTNAPLKTALTTSLTKYKQGFTSLEEIVNTVLATNGVVPPNLVAEFNTRINAFSVATKDLQQTINDSLSAINKTVSEGLVESAKQEIQAEISDVSDALTNLDETMNGEFKAGLISSSKSIALKERADAIDKEISDITAQYNVMMANDKLASTKKTKLTELKGVVDVKNSQLQNLIKSTMIDYIFTEAEITQIRTVIAELQTAINAYGAHAQECNADIALNTAQGVVDAITDEEVFNKVTQYGIKQGMFIEGDQLYINGQYIQTRNFTAIRDDGTETLKIDAQGNVHLNVKTFTLSPDSVTNVYTKDDVDSKIDEVNKRNMYSVNILSTNGSTFKNGKVSTVLRAVVYKWDEDVTSEFNASQFIWTRTSANTASDTVWNNANKGVKQVTIEMTDMKRNTTFTCDVVDVNGQSILN